MPPTSQDVQGGGCEQGVGQVLGGWVIHHCPFESYHCCCPIVVVGPLVSLLSCCHYCCWKLNDHESSVREYETLY